MEILEEEDVTQVFDAAGWDNEGNTYSTIEEMWEVELKRRFKKKRKITKASEENEDGEEKKEESAEAENETEENKDDEKLSAEELWYAGGAAYWNNEEASLSGVLGGLTNVHGVDISTSKTFILSLKCNRNRALDCGAGIGRVTKDVLTKIFATVDLVEQSPKYVEKARQDLAGNEKVGQFFCEGLQTFTPEAGAYDLMWTQWVVGHLTDDDMVRWLQRCKEGLTANGYICLKENTARNGFYLDKDDFSITRTDEHFRQIFQKAGLQVAKSILQSGFPKQLFPVRIYALR
eukprot:TRINITY_DN723_c0_g1_i2.p1 TRINITY_DN723_c0_g1~~TRINITY_DN723_c0_g1_i2.p1  ORF type:complete len:316 (+),score=108.75 TRINITY_DN723_c0_g1_i2:79-948(+)